MSVAGLADSVVIPLIRALVQAGRSSDDNGELSKDGVAERFARAAWSCIAEPGDRLAGMLIDLLGAEAALALVLDRPTPDALLDVIDAENGSLESPGRAARREEVAAALGRWSPRFAAQSVLRALEQSRRLGVGLVIPGDPEWPSAVADLGEHRPTALWFRGARRHWNGLERGIAVVGARAATGYGEHVATELASGLVDRGYTVVSGAAYGIDGAAHRAALAAAPPDGSGPSRGSVPTIAILAGGLDRYYPSGHDELITRIADRGLVISEVPCGTAPTRWRFLMRNRIIAAATRATVVVEAGHRSGSINTAHHAMELGRPIAAVPGPVTGSSSAGCHRILRDWPSTLVTSAAEVAQLAPLDEATLFDRSETPQPEPGSAERPPVDPESTRLRLVDALSQRSPRSVERIAALSGLALDRIRAELGMLELDGAVRRHPTGWTKAAPAASPPSR